MSIFNTIFKISECPSIGGNAGKNALQEYGLKLSYAKIY